MPTPLGYEFNGESLILTEAAGIISPTVRDSASQTQRSSTSAYASFAEQFLPGVINAQIISGDNQRPVKNASVTLRQYVDTSATSFETGDADSGLGTAIFSPKDTTVISKESGRILVGGLPPGVYEVRLSPAESERSPVQPAPVDVVIKPNSESAVRLVTAVSQLQLARCARHKLQAGIYGVVRLGDGPVPPFAITTAATITADWTAADGKKHQRQAFADNEGRYQLCDLPKDIPVTLRAVLGGRGSVRARSDDRVAPVEQIVVLGEGKVAYVPFQIPAKTDRQ